MVYVGANDGMLHAFDDAHGQRSLGVHTHRSSTGRTAPGWAPCRIQDGALPPFKHHFYVDSTPRVIDVNFGGGRRLALASRRRPRQGRQVVLRARRHRSGQRHRRDDGGEERVCGSSPIRHGLHLWPADDRQDARAFGGEWVVIVPSGYNNVTERRGAKIFIVRRNDRRAAPDTDAPGASAEAATRLAVRTRAHRGLHEGLPQPDRRADLRRRPVRQLLALRHLRLRIRANWDSRQIVQWRT